MTIANRETHVPDGVPLDAAPSRSPRRRLYRFAKTLYRAIPRPLRALAYPIAAKSVLIRRLRPEVWIIAGEEQVSHLPLSVCLYAATNENRIYLQNLIFGSSFRARYIGRIWLWNAFTGLPEAAKGCSIVIADVHDRHLKLMGARAGIIIPAWVRGYVDLPRSPAVIRRDSVKDIQRRIRREGLEFEVTRDLQSFDYFYQNMHVPYLKGRYGDSAVVSSREEIKAQFDNGELILVKKKGEYISGAIVSYQGELASFPYLGVLDGRWEFVAGGAISASYEFVLQHLETTSCRKANFGQSRAFLNDGVLRFKKKYGYEIVNSTIHKFLTKVVSDTNATRAFLRNNPFIVERSGKFYGVVFLDGEVPPTPQTLQEINKQHSHAGLLKILVCSFSPDATTKSEVPKPLPDLNPDGSSRPPGQPHYEYLSQAEWMSLIGELGAIGIDNVIAICPDVEGKP